MYIPNMYEVDEVPSKFSERYQQIQGTLKHCRITITQSKCLIQMNRDGEHKAILTRTDHVLAALGKEGKFLIER